MDKWYPEFDRCDGDEARVGLFGFVVAGGDPAPVLEFVEQPLDEIAPFVFGPVVREMGARRLLFAGITASTPAAAIS